MACLSQGQRWQRARACLQHGKTHLKQAVTVAAMWLQVATAFAYSGLNTTAAFPTLALNGIVNYANPIDATHQSSVRC